MFISKPIVMLSLMSTLAYMQNIVVKEGGYVVVMPSNNPVSPDFFSWSEKRKVSQGTLLPPSSQDVEVICDDNSDKCVAGTFKVNEDFGIVRSSGGRSFRRGAPSEFKQQYSEILSKPIEKPIENDENFKKILKTVIGSDDSIEEKASLIDYLYKKLSGPSAMGGFEILFYIPMIDEKPGVPSRRSKRQADDGQMNDTDTKLGSNMTLSRFKRESQHLNIEELDALPREIKDFVARMELPACPKINDRIGYKCNSYFGLDFDRDLGICHNSIFCNQYEIINTTSHVCEKSIPRVTGMECGSAQYYKSAETIVRIINNSVRPPMKVKLQIPSDVCRINGVITGNECTETYSVNKLVYISYDGKNVNNYWSADGMVESIDTSSINSYKCTGCEDDCSKCKIGPSEYHSYFQMKSVECSCILDQDKAIYSINNEGTIRPSLVIITDMFNVEYNIAEMLVERCNDCDVKCESSGIKINSYKLMRSIVVCIHKKCKVHKPSEFIPLDLSDILSSHVVEVSIYYGKIGEKKVSLTCDVHDFCASVVCHACLQRIMNPSCYSNIEIAMFVGLGIILYLVLSTMFFAIKLISIVKSILKIPINFIFYIIKLGFKIVHKLFNKIKSTSVVKESMNISNNNMLKPSLRKPSSPKAVKFSRLQSTLLILSLISMIEACSDSIKLESEQMKCVVSSQHETCSTVSAIDMSLSPIGQDSCLYIVNKENTIIGHVIIKTLSTDYVCDQSNLYWTYMPTSRTEKVYRCHSVGNCNDEYCLRNGKTLDASLSPDLILYAGETGCNLVDGGWGNTCFYFNSACVFYRTVLKVQGGKYYSVTNCPSYSWIAKVKIQIKLENDLFENEYNLIPNTKINTRVGTVILNSLSTTQSPILNKCFMKSADGSVSLVSCSDHTELIKGKVGEVRCDTEEQAKGGLKACKYAAGLIKISQFDSDIKVMEDFLDLNAVHSENLLPISMEGLSIHNDNSDYIISFNQKSSFSLRVELKDIKIRPYYNSLTCSVKFVSIKGCYLCDRGAEMTLKVSSDVKGSVRMDCKSLGVEMPLVLSGNPDEVMSFHISIKKPILNDKCILSCKEEKEFDVKGKLYFVENSNIISSGNGFSHDIFIPLNVASNWISGLDTVERVFSLIMTIIVVIVLVAAAICVSRMLSRRRFEKQK